MATTGLSSLDRAIHKTHEWLKDLMGALEWKDRNRAYGALRAVLHALRDRLMPDEAVQLGSQLPLIIRGAYYEGWNPSASPGRERSKEDFLTRVAEPLARTPEIDAERITRAVFGLLSRRVSEGEISDVRQILPGEVKALWPAPSGGVAEKKAKEGEGGAGRRGRVRAMRREMRRTIARARVRGVPDRDLPVIQARKRKGRGPTEAA